jgi:hypothetical protein
MYWLIIFSGFLLFSLGNYRTYNFNWQPVAVDQQSFSVLVGRGKIQLNSLFDIKSTIQSIARGPYTFPDERRCCRWLYSEEPGTTCQSKIRSTDCLNITSESPPSADDRNATAPV